MLLRDLILNQSGPTPVNALPADDTTYGPVVIYDSATHIGTLPVPVVNDQRWVKDPEDVEYLGVGGVWVAQPTKSQGVWMWIGAEWVLDYNVLASELNEMFTDELGNQLVEIP